MARILFISSLEAAPWGAAEELWYRTAVDLSRRGVPLAASVHRWPVDPEPVRHLESLGVAVFRRGGAPPSELLGSLLESFAPDRALVSQPDVFSGVHWMAECGKRRLPYATVTHYTSETEWPDDSMVFDLADGYARAERAWFVSRASLRLTERQIARRLPAAEVVRCPFKVPYDADLPWPGLQRGLRLACVARLDPEDKGHDLIFEVLADPKWRQRDLSVTLYGSGNFQRSLEAQLGYWEIDSVRFGGYVSDLCQVWESHHGLILGSRAEGLPAAIVEAMLCARVCVVTDVGGNGELLEDGRTGFIAAYPRASAIDEALERLWAARPRLEEMGRLARESIRRQVPPDPAAVFGDLLLSLAPKP